MFLKKLLLKLPQRFFFIPSVILLRFQKFFKDAFKNSLNNIFVTILQLFFKKYSSYMLIFFLTITSDILLQIPIKFLKNSFQKILREKFSKWSHKLISRNLCQLGFRDFSTKLSMNSIKKAFLGILLEQLPRICCK